MTEAEEAYAAAERRIAEAKADGRPALGLREAETQALEVLPPEIAELTSLELLDLRGTQVSDLDALSELASLEWLYLGDAQVSDVGVLSGLVSLKYLDLRGTQVSDLDALSGLTSLKMLYLGGTQVSDVGALSELVSLESLDLGGTHVSDIGALSGLVRLERLTLHETQVADLRPVLGLKGLSEAREFKGLTFQGCVATEVDDEIRRISEIEDDSQRARELFAYLEDWEPPGEPPSVPPQEPAPLQTLWVDDTLTEAPSDPELAPQDEELAREGWQALKDFYDEAQDLLRKDNMPNLNRAMDAFGRSLGERYEDMRVISVATHGQRIIEISKQSDGILMEDAAGDLIAFSGVISTLMQRFPRWRRYVTTVAEPDAPLRDALPALRDLSAVFHDADDVSESLARKFDDLIEMAEDDGLPDAFVQTGVLVSLSNILSSVASKALDVAKAIKKKTGEYTVNAIAAGIVGGAPTAMVSIIDLAFNNGRILASLAKDYPTYLGWIENVLRVLGKV
ncbi:MAG: leucine-rich repeat domain-containing protein [Aliishimia sp.]